MRNRVLLACLALSWTLVAQTPDLAALRGSVRDPSQAAVAGARVTVTNTRTGRQQAAQTDAAGRFDVPALPVASYVVSVAKPGFLPARIAVTLKGGATSEVHFQLSLAGGRTSVTVTGAVGAIGAQEPQLGTHLSVRQIEQTPLLGRKLTSLPLLNSANRPAINQGDLFVNQTLFTTNGSGRRQTAYEVNGSSGNDSWGRQTIFSTVPVMAVEEMTVLDNAFSAEYGATTGGVVNIVTKSGGDRWHGDLLEAWRPSSTEARLPGLAGVALPVGADTLSDTLSQTGWSLSGPLARGTEFYLAGEASLQDRGSLVSAGAAPTIFTGKYRGGLLYARLDHQIDADNDLFFRADVDSFHDTNPNGTVGGLTLPSADRVFSRRTYTAQLGETAILSPNLVNAARLQFQLASPITQFAPVDFSTAFVVPGNSTAGNSQSALLLNRQYEASDTLSAVRGRHQLRFGTDALLAHSGGNSKEFGGAITQGQFTFKPCPPTDSAAFCAGPGYQTLANAQSYTQGFGNAAYTTDDALWSVFLQDNFQAAPRLNLSLGLRYERQTFTDAHDDFAPRAGFAYQLAGGGRTVLRGGYGIYYSQIPDNSAADFTIGGPQGIFNYTAQPGQPGFPASIAGAPLPAFPPGVTLPPRSISARPGNARYLNRFLPVALLEGYPGGLLNPYSQRWTLGVERQLAPQWLLSADYIGTHTVKIVRPLDLDAPAPFVRTAPGQVRSAAAANCTRPLWVAFYASLSAACGAAGAPQPPYSAVDVTVNDGAAYYDALAVNLSHQLSDRFYMLASYTWSRAIDTVDPDIPSQSPNDANFTGALEKADAIFDQRQRAVISGAWFAPWRLSLGGVATLASGTPYNVLTGVDNNGDGSRSDRPVIQGAVLGRNTGRGTPIYDAGVFVQRVFALPDRRWYVSLRVEAFNLLNHANVVGFNGTYGNLASGAPLPSFGQPLTGISNVFPGRELQFTAHLGW